jgi:hypothetical protein
MCLRTTTLIRSSFLAATIRTTSTTSSRTSLFKPALQVPKQPVYRTMATTTPLTAWKRLIRYVSTDGTTRYGEPILSGSNTDIDALAQSGELKVIVLEGANPWDAQPTGKEDSVKTLLGPLTPDDVPIVRCVGLNYRTHSKWSLPPNRLVLSCFEQRC